MVGPSSRPSSGTEERQEPGLGSATQPRQPDRRYLRSRRAIRAAFVDLVLERGYGRLTVELLAARADLARATFYAHYDSLEELLGEVVRELVDDLLVVARASAPTGPNPVMKGAAIRALCTHAQEHGDLYRVILSGAGNGSGRATYVGAVTAAASHVFRRLVRSNDATEQIEVEVIARAWAASFVALLEWWLLDHPDRSVEEVTAIGTALLVKGYMWGMGVDTKVSLSCDLVEQLPAVGAPDLRALPPASGEVPA